MRGLSDSRSKIEITKITFNIFSGRSALMRIQNAEGEDDYRKMSIKRASVESARTSSRVGEKTPLVVADGQTTVTTLAAQSVSKMNG